MKKVIDFLKKKDLYLGIVRYMLGLSMMPYALTKILRTQFVVIPATVWQRPLEYASGKNIAWSFLGHSAWFQVLLGFLELVPSILLLFRRTTLTGAILLLPMTLNVLLINYALNLWDGTKIMAIQLLVMNVIVLIFEWKAIWAFILIVIKKGKTFRFNVAEISINLIVIAVATYFYLQPLLEYKAEKNVLTGNWIDHQPNEWKLLSETKNGVLIEHNNLKAYFGAYGDYSELSDTGYVKRGTILYKLDEKKHTLTFLDDTSEKPLFSYNYQLSGDTLLTLNRLSSDDINIVRKYRKRVMHEAE